MVARGRLELPKTLGRPIYSQEQLPLCERAKTGGLDKVRTCDIRLAKPALSQLSYEPTYVVGLEGVEPPRPKTQAPKTCAAANYATDRFNMLIVYTHTVNMSIQ